MKVLQLPEEPEKLKLYLASTHLIKPLLLIGEQVQLKLATDKAKHTDTIKRSAPPSDQESRAIGKTNGGAKIGEAAAETSGGFFQADVWQCGNCKNINWACRPKSESLKPASTTSMLGEDFGLVGIILDNILCYCVAYYNLSQIMQF